MRLSRPEAKPGGLALSTSACFRWGLFSGQELETVVRLERAPLPPDVGIGTSALKILIDRTTVTHAASISLFAFTLEELTRPRA
jgi:hypothetical protein